MRKELIKRLVKAHRRDDDPTMVVLAHIMADIVGSPFFIAGVTRSGTLNWTRPFPMGSAAELKARVQAVLNRGSHNEAHTMVAEGDMRKIIYLRTNMPTALKFTKPRRNCRLCGRLSEISGAERHSTRSSHMGRIKGTLARRDYDSQPDGPTAQEVETYVKREVVELSLRRRRSLPKLRRLFG
jgi:hypothetical protein